MRWILVLVTGSIFGSAMVDAHAIEISNVKTGLACIKTAAKAGSPGWVCQPTEDILIVDQGSCVYDKKEVPCTWTGIEFDYKDAKPGTKLVCTVMSSEPTTDGNPTGAAKSGAKTITYELPLHKAEGHRFEAQYVVFGVRDSSPNEVVQKTTCSVDGEAVMSYTQRFHYPSPH